MVPTIRFSVLSFVLEILQVARRVLRLLTLSTEHELHQANVFELTATVMSWLVRVLTCLDLFLAVGVACKALLSGLERLDLATEGTL